MKKIENQHNKNPMVATTGCTRNVRINSQNMIHHNKIIVKAKLIPNKMPAITDEINDFFSNVTLLAVQ